MDNPYSGWSSLSTRPPLRWPDGARVALCVIVSLERTEWQPPQSAVTPPSASLFGPWPNVFSLQEPTWHEYGNRVGVFRVMDVLDRLGIRGTAAFDAALARDTPFLVDQVLQRDWEVIGHGVAFSQMITDRMDEEEERDYIDRALSGLEEACGARPLGWLGPDYGESSRTVRLLAEAGVRYVCDWPNDDQPNRLTVPTGGITALPVALDLDDALTHRQGNVTIQRWATNVVDAFEQLHADGERHGRVLVLNLHPYVIGRPLRIRYLEKALSRILEHSGVWLATGREIVDWYEAHGTADVGRVSGNG